MIDEETDLLEKATLLRQTALTKQNEVADCEEKARALCLARLKEAIKCE